MSGDLKFIQSICWARTRGTISLNQFVLPQLLHHYFIILITISVELCQLLLLYGRQQYEILRRIRMFYVELEIFQIYNVNIT